MKTIAVIGVGNILFSDEGVGVYASRYLRENYRFTPPIEIVDGGTLGFNLMEYLFDYDRVLLLDTLSIDDMPGSIYHLPSEALLGLGDSRKTVHEIEVTQMIEMGTLVGTEGEVSVVGIIPEDIHTVAIALSPTLHKRFGEMIETVLKLLEEGGVSAVANNRTVTLDAIIEGYASPSAHVRGENYA